MNSPVPFGPMTQYFDWHEAKTWSTNATDSQRGGTKGPGLILMSFLFFFVDINMDLEATTKKEQRVYGLIFCLVLDKLGGFSQIKVMTATSV